MTLSTNSNIVVLKRVLITIGTILFVRVGTFFPIPTISTNSLNFYINSHPNIQPFITKFVTNDNFVLSLFELNVFPSINASLILQLLLKIIPKLSAIQKEGDLSSRRYINQITRILTLIAAIFQSLALVFSLKEVFGYPALDYFSIIETIVWLTSGAMIILWCSELITTYGIGNGLSILVAINIISNVPKILKSLIIQNNITFSTYSKIEIGLISLACLCGIAILEQGIINLRLISSKELNNESDQNFKKNSNYLPIRLNRSGVMPIIVTTFLALVPNYINQLELFKNNNVNTLIFESFYWPSYFGLIVILSQTYANFVLSPKEISDQLQKLSAVIPGVRSGNETAFYLKQLLDRTSFIGAIFLACLAVIPNFLLTTLNITSLNLLGTSSLLIVAGVIIEVKREIDNIYYSNIYQDED